MFFVFLIGGTCEARAIGMAVRATSSEPSKERFDWRIGNREAMKSIVSDCRAEFCRAAADEFVVSR